MAQEAGTAAESRALLEMVRDAGNLLLRDFGQEIRVDEKGPQDLVTEADLAAEELILERIRRQFPSDAITAEESGRHSGSEREWFIDPLDGTVNFAHRIPSFAVCVAFADGGEVKEAAIFNPVMREVFSASRGRGAFLNGLPICCSKTGSLRNAHVFVNPHGLRREDSRALRELYRRVGLKVQGMLNPGSMSQALCAAARSQLDAGLALDVDVYSTPASSLILEEAGAVMTDMNGERYHPRSATFIAAAPGVHGELLELLRDL